MKCPFIGIYEPAPGTKLAKQKQKEAKKKKSNAKKKPNASSSEQPQQQQQQNKKTNAQKAYDEWQQQQQHSTHAYKHFPDDEGDMDQLSDAERAEIEEHNRREYYDPQAAGFDYEESDAGADDHDTTSTVGDKWMQSQSGEWQQDQQNSGNGGGSFVAPQNVRVKSREEVLRQQQEQQRSKQQTKQRTSVEILGGSAKVKFADE